MSPFHRKKAASFNKGFTLVEILVTITIILILTAVVLASISSIKAHGRNAERSTDVSTILNAVYQYAVDNNNQLPSTITTSSTEICKTGASPCTGYIDLSVLTTNQKYIVSLPTDPSSTSTVGTGYFISKDANNRVIVAAPKAEASTTISVTR
jgi:prepilin-type N-terminal cleavage/methylation domain-containing protein